MTSRAIQAISRAPLDHVNGPLHGLDAPSVQEFLERLTSALRGEDAIEQVAERIGGVDRMVEWVQEDPANERA